MQVRKSHLQNIWPHKSKKYMMGKSNPCRILHRNPVDPGITDYLKKNFYICQIRQIIRKDMAHFGLKFRKIRHQIQSSPIWFFPPISNWGKGAEEFKNCNIQK